MLLEIDDLRVSYASAKSPVRAVDGVSLTLDTGESFGLVGESGCGKTTLISSILRVLPPGGRIVRGSIRLDGTDLVALSERDMNAVRWRRVALVTQSAMNALDPVYRVGDQIAETLAAHTDLSPKQARARAAELFTMVGLEPGRLDAYPHQLSGGMRQRAVIALALALEPSVILADEPTTALDVVVQAGIMSELRDLQERLGSSLVLVSHDIALVGQTCHRFGVMYGGKLVEVGPAGAVLAEPVHPYTMGLLNAFPTLERAKGELVSIPGTPPDLSAPPPGCRFASRCPFATERCRVEEPPLVTVGSRHEAACHYPERQAELRALSARPETWVADEPAATAWSPAADGDAGRRRQALELTGVRRHFPVQRDLASVLARRPRKRVHAVDGVTLTLRPGEILGLAGESGSGKSTLGEMIAGLQPPTDGELRLGGELVPTRRDAHFRRRVQMVFQDPYETLNPRFTIAQTVAEPLRNLELGEPSERPERVQEALRLAGLHATEDLLGRHPHELSGGQRQRVAIARAIVVDPELLVADEPVSMLDVSIRAGVLNLFKRFRDLTGTSILYVSHDLATIRYVADRTAVLYLGRVAEIGPSEQVVEHPRHPYTRLLLSAVPDPGRPIAASLAARTEMPSPVDLPNGCRFHGRCPYAMAHCGWEGRDLERLVHRRRVLLLDADEPRIPAVDGHDEDALLAAVTTAETDGTDLHVRTRPGWARPVASYLRALMARDERSSIAEAVSAVDIGERGVRVAFARRDEPPHYPVGPDHAVACLLYEDADGRGTDLPVVTIDDVG